MESSEMMTILKEVFEKMEEEFNKGLKVSRRRARVHSNTLTKLLKEFRKKTQEEDK